MSLANTAEILDPVATPELQSAFVTSPSADLILPTPETLRRIANARGGDLRTAPFGALLLALYREKRSCVVDVRRKHLRKRILIENGSPLECRSNVLHDTFSYYLREAGHLSQENYETCTKEALRRGIPVGEVLLSRGLLTSEQILSLLQKLLAKVLLDVFAWADGSFLILDQTPEIQAPLKLRVEQLVLTGGSRFTPQVQVEQALSGLAGAEIAAYSEGQSRYGTYLPSSIRLGATDREVVKALRREPLSLRDLTMLLQGDETKVQRSVYALAQLGVLDFAERVSATANVATFPELVSPPEAAPSTRSALSKEELCHLYLDHRRMNPFRLLDVEETATPEVIEAAYLLRSQAIGEWIANENRKTANQARELQLAIARAFGELSDVDRATELRDEAQSNPSSEPPVIPDLLDPSEHYSQGVEQMESGDYNTALSNLEIASDCNPQRGLYRAQAAYCLFMKSKDHAAEALEILVDTHRLDPTCGLAFLYAGEVMAALERFEEAEESLRTASKLMAPDRRPIEKLREMRQLERSRG